MKTALMIAALVSATTLPVYAADSTTNGQGLEQKKTEILKHIDQRIAHEQGEKSCVQSASSHDELRACRDKFRPKQKEERRARIQ